jgi:hypothetical protein
VWNTASVAWCSSIPAATSASDVLATRAPDIVEKSGIIDPSATPGAVDFQLATAA